MTDSDDGPILPDDAFGNDLDDEIQFELDTYDTSDSSFLIGPGDMILSNSFLEEAEAGFFSKNPEIFLNSSGRVIKKEPEKTDYVRDQYTDFYPDLELAKQLAADDMTYDSDARLAQQFATYHYVDNVESLQKEIRTEQMHGLYTELSLSRSLSKSKKYICKSEDSMTESIFSPVPIEIFSWILSYVNLKKLVQIRTVNKFFRTASEKILLCGEIRIGDPAELWAMCSPPDSSNLSFDPMAQRIKKSKKNTRSRLVKHIMAKTHTVIYKPISSPSMKMNCGSFGFTNLQKVILIAQYKYEVDSLDISPCSNLAYHPVGRPKGMRYIVYICDHKNHCQVCQFDEIYQGFTNHCFSFPNVTLYHNGKFRLGYE